MAKCKCYEEEVKQEKISEFERGFLWGIRCYKDLNKEEQKQLDTGYKTITVSRCNGTGERDICTCDGDESRCTFYPKKRGE